MKEFQGWTPATIDNLTFDQIGAIFEELAKQRGKRKTENLGSDRIPSTKMTRKDIDSWIKKGYPSLLKQKKR